MGKLPGGDRAFIDPEKISGYVLNPYHRLGQHKARVFASVLGIGPDNSGEVMEALKAAAIDGNADYEGTDVFGARYVIEFIFINGQRSGRIKSSWIVRAGEDFPRFVTAMVAKQDKAND